MRPLPRRTCRGGRRGTRRGVVYLRCAAGVTLVEVLVAAVLAILVCGSAVALLGLHASLARALQSELGAGSACAWALEVVLRDVQAAGNDPARIGVAALRSGSREALEIDADLDGDGRLDTASMERLALYWGAASGGRVLRRLGAQSVGFAAPVAAGGFVLRYRGVDGAELGAGAGGALASSDLARVRRVDVEIAVRTDDATREVRLRSSAAIRARLPVRGVP